MIYYRPCAFVAGGEPGRDVTYEYLSIPSCRCFYSRWKYLRISRCNALEAPTCSSCIVYSSGRTNGSGNTSSGNSHLDSSSNNNGIGERIRT